MDPLRSRTRQLAEAHTLAADRVQSARGVLRENADDGGHPPLGIPAPRPRGRVDPLCVCLTVCLGLAWFAPRVSAEPQAELRAPQEVEDPWEGEDSIASRFLADAAGSHPDFAAWAEALAQTLPERVETLTRSPDGAAVQELYYVCWGLAFCGSGPLDLLAEEIGGVRELLLGVGGASVARDLDLLLVQELVNAGRRAAARAQLTDALEAWPEDAVYLLTERADLGRLMEQWGEARADLELARELLGPEEDGSWAQRVALEGVCLQLELALGRLEVASLALDRSERALERGLDLWGGEAGEVFVEIALHAQNEADYNLTAARYDLVVSKLTRLLEQVPELDGDPSIRAQLALAHDGLELEDPDRPRRAQEMLRELFRDPNLSEDGRLAVGLRLAISHLSAGQLEATAELVPELERALEAWDEGPDATRPLLQLGALRTVKSRLARARGAGTQELASHLEELNLAYVDLLAARARTPVLPGGLGFLQWGDRQEVLAELLALRRACDPRGAEAGLEDLLAGEAQGSLARRLELPVPTLAEIRAALLAGGGILVYAPSIRGGHVLTIDEGEVQLWDLGHLPYLKRLTRSATSAGFAPQAEATRQLGGELLPPPVLERVRRWSHVYVVGLSELPGIPFESLPMGAEPDAPLIGRTLAVGRLPSLIVGVWLSRGCAGPTAAEPASLALWVAFEPSAAARERQPQLVSLPFGAAERERLESPFGGVGESVFLAQPTLEALRGADLGDAQLLHLWCHGYWDDASERPASLVLAASAEGDDGIVGCGEVETPQRPYPQLVILSACGAALGPQRPGEDGVGHLGGAFLVGGARAVLLAEGDLYTREALELAAAFHGFLAGGASPAEALRRARSGLEGEVPMRLVGLAHRPIFAPRPGSDRSWLPWSLAALAAAIAAALFARSRRRARSI